MTATAPEEEVTPLHKVWNPDRMDRITLARHLTHRHNDALDHVNVIGLFQGHMDEDIEELWRIYHDRLHDVLEPYHEELTHEHET